MYLPSSSMATPVGVTFHVSWSTVMSTALSSMFLIIICSFLVVSPLKFCVTAVKLAASLCCPIRQGGVGVDAPADVIYSTRGACLPAIAPGWPPLTWRFAFKDKEHLTPTRTY